MGSPAKWEGLRDGPEGREGWMRDGSGPTGRPEAVAGLWRSHRDSM